MKIGINLRVISNLGNVETCQSELATVNTIKCVNFNIDSKKVLKSLIDENHAVYIFVPVAQNLNAQNKKTLKKSLVKRLQKEGYQISKLAVVNQNDLVEVAKRNYVDIMVDVNENVVTNCKKFTDAVLFTNQNADDLLKKINCIIAENREIVLYENAVAKGLPSEDKLWLKTYRKGDYKWTKENLSPYDRLTHSNADFLDETSMEFFGKKFTYQDFIDEIDKAANAMVNAGIKKGEKVPLVVANTPESLIVLYALFKIKATVTPIFALSAKDDFEEKLKDLNANYMFMSDLCYGRVKDVVPEKTKVIVLPVGQSMNIALRTVFEKVLKPKLGVIPVKYNDKFISLKDFIAKNSFKTNTIDTSYEEDYVAIQLYTGGTVKAKGVLLSAGNLDAASKQFFNDRYDFKRGDKIAAFMPLNHSFGLVIGTHVSVSLGINLDIIMKIDFKRLDKLFIKDRINLFGGIPTMFPAIRNNKKIQKSDLSNVKYVLSGGSVLPPQEAKELNKFLEDHNSDARVSDGYGKTETCAGIIYDGIINMNTVAKIVKPGTQEEIGYDQKGELCLSGPSIMMSYSKTTENPHSLQVHEDGRTWLHTDDFAYITEEGRIRLVGRIDRMIKSNGECIFLDDVEADIDAHEAILKSVVSGKVDKIKGFVPVAFLELNDGYTWNAELEESIKKFYERKLPKHSIPIKTTVLDKLPETPLGKIDFKKLEKEAEKL